MTFWRREEGEKHQHCLLFIVLAVYISVHSFIPSLFILFIFNLKNKSILTENATYYNTTKQGLSNYSSLGKFSLFKHRPKHSEYVHYFLLTYP